MLLSVAIVGTLTWLALGLIGRPLSLMVSLTFGGLISPTDPIAVMGLLKELHAPSSLGALAWRSGTGYRTLLSIDDHPLELPAGDSCGAKAYDPWKMNSVVGIGL